MPTPKPRYSSRPVGPAKRFDEWMTCGNPSRRVNARPDLAAARGIFGYRYDAWDMRIGADRERPADQSRHLRQPPADPAEADLDDLADVNGGVAVRKALGKPLPGRRWQAFPVVVRQQRAKPQIAQRG